MKNDKKLQKNPEPLPEEPVALTVDEIETVTGAGNPFDNVPRVPVKPIDDDLRGDA